MGLLDSFERGLERAVNGAFAKAFKSGLQPIEITSALRRELDTKAAIVSRDRILVPNEFAIRLAPTDFSRMTGLGPTLIDELTRMVQQHAAAQRYQFAGAIAIALMEDPALSPGMIQVDSQNVAGSVSWVPVIEIGGVQQTLSAPRTVIGRGHEADVVINDSGISRKHLEILWDGSRGQARDLGSTNGSRLNGQPLSTALLEPDSVIDIGKTRIVFRVLAQSSPGSAAQSPGLPGSRP